MKMIVLIGNKKEMERCKVAFLNAEGDYSIYIKSLDIKRKGLLKQELTVVLESLGNTKEFEINFKNFLRRVGSNYKILSGNILGLLDYM